jgi:hypothetical protein
MDHRPSATTCAPVWSLSICVHVGKGKPHIDWVLRAVKDVVQMSVDKLNSLVESRLVVTVQVGQVDLEPA